MQESIYLSLDRQLEARILYLFSQYPLRFYKKGEVIAETAGMKNSMFCSESGYIIVYSISPKGQRDVRSIGGARCLFPVRDFFSPRHADEFMPPRNSYFEALTDCYIRHMPEDVFNLLIKRSLKTQIALLKQFSINHRLSMARIEMMQLRDIQMRVASLFLGLTLTFGQKYKGGYYIKVPLSHQLIADTISTARETVSREISKLRKGGLIDSSGNHFIIPSIDALKKLVESY